MSDELQKARLDPNSGYTFTHDAAADRLRDGYDVLVTAHAPGASGQAKVGHTASAGENLRTFFQNGGVGYLQIRYSGKTNRSSTAYSDQVYVHPDHRRKGVASAMYAYAEKQLGIKMVPSKDRTKDGKALWAGNKRDPQFGKSEDLAKAVDPKDMVSIAKASDPAGADLVDHTPHLTGHPAAIQPQVDAYRTHVLQSPEVVKPISKKKSGISDGISKKVIYETPHPGSVSGWTDKHLVKPYHERVIKRVGKWMKHPHQGWAEMANQALYHAAGIGHLHQAVHTSEHDFGTGKPEPALVVHLAPEHIPANNASQPLLPEGRHAARQIAMMDFLTGNLDRHGGNLLRHYSGKTPLAIDHSRSFQYIAPNDERRNLAPTKRPRDIEDTFEGYHKGSSVDKLAPFLHDDSEQQRGYAGWGPPREELYDAKRRSAEDYGPVFDWWGENSDKVRGEMDRQLQQIKDPEVRAHIKRNFDARADWLDERANIGIENYGENWYRDNGVPMYRPGQMSEDEQRQARDRAAAEQWARENPDKV